MQFTQNASQPWRDRAACKGGTRIYFGSHVCEPGCSDDCPELDNRSTLNQERNAAAKAVCARCPVLDDCRAWILANPRECEIGVVAGMTDSERKRRNWNKGKRGT